MSPLTIIWSMLSAASLVIGLVHTLVWMQDRRQRVYLAAAIMALASGVNALGELGLMKAPDVGRFVMLVRFENTVIAVMLVAMVWFVALDLRTARRSLLWAITGLWAACAVLNVFSPASLTYAAVDALVPRATFWGEEFVLATGPTNPWKWIADLTSVLIIVYIADTSLRAWRRGRRRRAVVVGGSILGFIVAAGVHTPLVDAGVVKTPFMVSVAFFGIVLALSQQLARDAARSLVYARQVTAGQRRWNSLLADIQLAVLDVGADGRVRYVNPFYCRSTGWKEAAVVGRPLPDLVTPDRAGAIQERFELAAQAKGPRPQSRWTMATADGEARTFAWSTVRLQEPDGTFDGVLAVGADVTAEVRARADLAQARRELDRVMRANLLGEFVSALAHELNQPLAAILANAQTVRRYLQGGSPRVEPALNVMELIIRDDKRAATVLQRLRTMLTRGTVVRERLDPGEAVAEVLEICRSELRAQDITVVADLAERLPPVDAGRVEIQQVVLNLLRNAMQAMSRVPPERRSVRLAVRAVADQVEISVEDHGPGIPAPDRDTVFEAFRGHRAQGIGMGLAICRRIVEAHGGRIEAAAAPGGGARLVVTLPRAAEEVADAAAM